MSKKLSVAQRLMRGEEIPALTESYGIVNVTDFDAEDQVYICEKQGRELLIAAADIVEFEE